MIPQIYKLNLRSKTLRTSDFSWRKGTAVDIGVSPAPASRAAVIVGKTVSLHAVDRNLAKRRLHAILSEILKTKPVGHVIIRARKSILSLPFTDLEQEIRHTLGV